MVVMKSEKFDYFINGDNGKYEVVIGLEVHAQVLSNSKLFSGSPTKFGAEPNEHVSLIDSAFPGMLPTLGQVKLVFVRRIYLAVMTSGA